MTAVDRDPVTLAREVLDAEKVMDGTPGLLYLDGPTHEHEEAAGVILASAPDLARAVIDLTAKVKLMEALEAALEKVLELHPREVVLHADPEFGQMEDDAICSACIVNHEAADWPCPNVRAITTALEATR